MSSRDKAFDASWKPAALDLSTSGVEKHLEVIRAGACIRCIATRSEVRQILPQGRVSTTVRRSIRPVVLVTLLGAGLLSAAVSITATLALAPARAAELATAEVSRTEWNTLRTKVERLNAALDAARSASHAVMDSRVIAPAAARKAPNPSTLANLRATIQGQAERIRRLEEELRSLQRRALSLEAVPNSIEAIRKALADKNLYGNQVSDELRNRRMKLLERFLALAPTDPQAKRKFRQLFDDYMGTRQFERGKALLERMRGPLAFKPWELSAQRATFASLTGNRAEARRFLGQTANDPGAPETLRVRARFDIAHSYQQAGDYARAIPLYQALIRSYPDPPPPAVKDVVGGAKAMLAQIRRWQNQARKGAGK